MMYFFCEQVVFAIFYIKVYNMGLHMRSTLSSMFGEWGGGNTLGVLVEELSDIAILEILMNQNNGHR